MQNIFILTVELLDYLILIYGFHKDFVYRLEMRKLQNGISIKGEVMYI